METAARGIQFLLAIGIAYVIAIWFAIVAWTFRDIESRSRSVFTQVFSTLLVVLFFVPGLLLYLILRPKETLDQAFQRALEEEYLLQDLDDLPLCSGCQRAVEPDFVLCPHCQTRLRGPCPSCERLIDLRWGVCPYCAVAVDREALTEPAPRTDVRVLEDSPSGRRRRAVTAAARRVGLEADELDALTDALADDASNGASDAATALIGVPRRLTAMGDFARIRSGARTKLAQLGTHADSAGTATDGSAEAGAPNAGTETQMTAGFWSDPISRSERGRGQGS
jgi:RNA polymerase subunit RPABC4/transcription elongation factor Spt4